MEERFDKKKHVCKFYFKKYEQYPSATLRQYISGNLYLKELKIELLDRDDRVTVSVGFSLEEQLDTLLPLLHWEDFEKSRDTSGYEQKNNGGYRDGWGYDFLCMNESGYPLIRKRLDVLYNEKNKPAYEKLLDWMVAQYSKRDEFKKMKLQW
ncbi:MAG: hypothetical protein PUD20_11625 [bacterium]|nr:hypothetical protein [bacterium]